MDLYLLIWIQEGEATLTQFFTSHEEARVFLNQHFLKELSSQLSPGYIERFSNNDLGVWEISDLYDELSDLNSGITVTKHSVDPDLIAGLVAEHANPHAMLAAIARLQERAIQTDQCRS